MAYNSGAVPAIPTSNVNKRAQNTILRTISNVPWYVSNTEIHEHLDVTAVRDEIANSIQRYRDTGTGDSKLG